MKTQNNSRLLSPSKIDTEPEGNGSIVAEGSGNNQNNSLSTQVDDTEPDDSHCSQIKQSGSGNESLSGKRKTLRTIDKLSANIPLEYDEAWYKEEDVKEAVKKLKERCLGSIKGLVKDPSGMIGCADAMTNCETAIDSIFGEDLK